jgi:RNA polymerase sigma-70 factor (ECF subfamily)
VPQPDQGEESDAHVYEALRALRPRDREVLILSAWDELGAAEAAEVLGCSPTAYRIRLHRARRRFAQVLDETQADAARGGAHPVDLSVEEMTS